MRLGIFGIFLGVLMLWMSLDRQSLHAQEPASPHLLELATPDKGYLHFPVRILDRSTREALTFDPARDEPATISYHLTRDGNIRIRAVWRQDEELVLRTLLDWTRRDFGPHQVRWDGRDASGNLVDNTACRITFEGDDPVHQAHDPADCHEPSLEIFPPVNSTISDSSEIGFIIKGGTSFGRESGYSARYYVDYELAGEQQLEGDVEVFTLPSGLLLEDGEYLVTLNLDDGRDHVGVAAVRVNVANAGLLRGAGAMLFLAKGCDRCHQLTHARWVETGPGLQFIGSRRPLDYLRQVIVDPRSVNRTAKMPPEHVADEELGLLLDFLVSLERPPATARAGSVIYTEEGCADCHETEGEFGAMGGPELRGVGHLRTRGYLEGAVLEPRSIWPRTSMPPTLLSSQELENLVEFLVEK